MGSKMCTVSPWRCEIQNVHCVFLKMWDPKCALCLLEEVDLRKVIYDVKDLKCRESNTLSWNDRFQKLDLTSVQCSQILFSLNMFATSAVGSVCPKPVMQVIWDLMTVNSCRLILYRSLLSNQQIISVNSVTKYVDLKQVWESIWDCTGQMSIPKTGFLLVTYAAGFARVELA